MKPNAQRAREFRARIKAGEVIPTCSCGRQLKGEKSRKRGTCSICYKESPEWLQYLREYAAERYQPKRAPKPQEVKPKGKASDKKQPSKSKRQKPKARYKK